MQFKRIYLIVICLLVKIVCINSQNLCKSELNRILSLPYLKHASIGVCVKNITTGKVILDHNSEILLTPASTMKILVTAASIEILGKDFRFKTTLEYSGNISEDSILKGDLFINGGGDPTLGSDRISYKDKYDSVFANWIKAIKNVGIKRIEGSVIADGTIFDDNLLSGGAQWEDIGNYYGTGCSGLNFNENTYNIIFKPGAKENDTTSIIRTEPKIEYLRIINRVKTGSQQSGDNSIIFCPPYSAFALAEGTIPIDKPQFIVKGSIPDPPFISATLFTEYLNNNKITVLKKPMSIRDLLYQKNYVKPKTKFIIEHFSQSLDKIVYYTNQKSINLYAESLLRMLGYIKSGKGSTKGGIVNLISFWKNRNIDVEGLVISDGSGLSLNNKITSNQFINILTEIYKDKNIKEIFYNSLPVAGESGSIKNIFKGTIAENNLRAKSGYMKSVRSYAGYVKSKNGDMLCFAIIVNNFTGSPGIVKLDLEKLMVCIGGIE